MGLFGTSEAIYSFKPYQREKSKEDLCAHSHTKKDQEPLKSEASLLCIALSAMLIGYALRTISSK